MTDISDLARVVMENPPDPLTPAGVAQALREAGRPVGDAIVLRVHAHLQASTYGVLNDFMADDSVVSIHVSGDDIYVNSEPAAGGWSGLDPEAMRRFIQRLAARAGARIDDNDPYVDCRLPDGTRLRAYIGQQGLPLTARLDKNYNYSLDERVALGMLKPEAAEFLNQEGVECEGCGHALTLPEDWD